MFEQTPEEWVRNIHKLTVQFKYGHGYVPQWRADCSCKRLRTKWTKSTEDAEGQFNSHIRHEAAKEVKYRDKVGAARQGAGERSPDGDARGAAGGDQR